MEDIYRIIATQALAINSAAGAVTSIGSVSAQTYAIDLVYAGNTTTSTAGVRVGIGDLAGSVTSLAGALLPPSWIQRYKITPGQKIAAISNDAQVCNLTIIELSK